MSQGDSQQQHFVPQHYLRGFADSKQKTHVWVYNKGQAYSEGNGGTRVNPFRQGIKKAGAEPGFYSVTTIEGEEIPDRYEKAIARQEERGVEVLKKLRNRKPISTTEKVVFSIYIDLMMARVPARAVRTQQSISRAMEDYPWNLLATKAADEGRFGLARKFDPNRSESVAAIERELLLERVLRRSEAIVKKIASMSWLFFLVAGDCLFPTTDNPAFRPLDLGLERDNGFIVMPIDSKMTLLISNVAAPDRACVPATSAQYNLLRDTILSGAMEHAYACVKDGAILEGLSNPRFT
jgi:hypothetical protein